MGGRLRTRRRRHVAAALRALAPPAALPVQGGRCGAAGTRVAELAEAARLTLFADTDIAEALARLEPGQGIPPEVVLAVAAMLLPLLKERGR